MSEIQDCGWDFNDTIGLFNVVVSLAALFVNLLGIGVSALVAWWIVRTLQESMNRRRFLKEHFIREVIELAKSYEGFIEGIVAGDIMARSVINWFKRTNIRTDALLKFINRRYQVELDFLKAFQYDLREIVTNDASYEKAVRPDKLVDPSTELIRVVLDFHAANAHLFNELIMKINDAEEGAENGLRDSILMTSVGEPKESSSAQPSQSLP